jgi:hypothetical protein
MTTTEPRATLTTAGPRASFAGPLLAAALLTGLAGSGPARASGVAGDAGGPSAAVQPYYAHVMGRWIGATVCRVDGSPPVTGAVPAVIERIDAGAFREEYLADGKPPRVTATLPLLVAQRALTVSAGGRSPRQVGLPRRAR